MLHAISLPCTQAFAQSSFAQVCLHAALNVGAHGELAVESNGAVVGAVANPLFENLDAHKKVAEALTEGLQRQFLLRFPPLLLGAAKDTLALQLGHLQ